MGVALKVFRSREEPGSAASDYLGATVINVAGPDRESVWAPAVWLASYGDGAVLVPVIEGAVRWGKPSGNFAGAPGDPTWTAAARQASGGLLVEVFDAGPPTVPVTATPRTAATIAAEVRDHLVSNLRAHGPAETSVLVGGAVAGLARFIGEQHGHEAVRTVALELADEAERLILASAVPASDARQ